MLRAPGSAGSPAIRPAHGLESCRLRCCADGDACAEARRVPSRRVPSWPLKACGAPPMQRCSSCPHPRRVHNLPATLCFPAARWTRSVAPGFRTLGNRSGVPTSGIRTSLERPPCHRRSGAPTALSWNRSRGCTGKTKTKSSASSEQTIFMNYMKYIWSTGQGNGTNGVYGCISAMDTNGDSIDGFHLWSPKREQGAQHTAFKRHLCHRGMGPMASMAGFRPWIPMGTPLMDFIYGVQRGSKERNTQSSRDICGTHMRSLRGFSRQPIGFSQELGRGQND